MFSVLIRGTIRHLVDLCHPPLGQRTERTALNRNEGTSDPDYVKRLAMTVTL